MKRTFTFSLAMIMAISIMGQSTHNHVLNQSNSYASDNLKSTQVIKHRLDSTIYEDYYESKDEWYLDDKQDFTYDENGDMVESSWYYMENSQWLISDLTEFTYDDNGLIILKVENYWSENLGQMVTNYKEEYTYNSYGDLTLMLQTIWDLNNNQWEIGYKKEYNYDENGNISVTNDYHWEEDTEEWENGDSAVYAYDANEYIELVLVYEWDQDISEWKDNTKKEYTCDNNGNVTSRIISYMNYNTNEWSTYSKREYEYDANENPTLEINFYWDDSKGEWYEEYKYEYNYDLDYALSDMILPPLFYYNPDYFENITNMPIDYMKYNSNYGTNWYMSSRASYYYSEQNVTGVSDLSETSVKVFPNPASEFFIISLGQRYSQINFELIDMQGKKVIQKGISNNQKLDIRQLSKGLYFYRINGANETVKTGKIIIE